MSADNFVGVRPNKDGTFTILSYGNMSCYDEDCQYGNDEEGEVVNTRAEALVRAHDLVREMDICEYGVVEMSTPTDELCGHCFVCVHMRGVIGENVPHCDGCHEPIAGEWMVSTSEGTFHNMCVPSRKVGAIHA